MAGIDIFPVDNEGAIEEQLSLLLDSLCGMYADEETEYVRYVQNWLPREKEKKIPSRAYRGIAFLPFEMIELPVPIEYETVIKNLYGEDYMKPVKNAADHEYPSYALQEKELRELLYEKHISGNRFGIDTCVELYGQDVEVISKVDISVL